MEKMFKLGADVNDVDDEGRTPLHLAVQNNRYRFAKRLIAAGAKLTVTILKLHAHSNFFLTV